MLNSEEIGKIVYSITKDEKLDPVKFGREKSLVYWMLYRGDFEKLEKFNIDKDDLFEWANGDYNVNKYLKTLNIDNNKYGPAIQLTNQLNDWFLDEIELQPEFSKSKMKDLSEKFYVEAEKFIRNRSKEQGQLELQLESYHAANYLLAEDVVDAVRYLNLHKK